MVGIVIVSHSIKLAEGLRDLIEQMVQGQVPIAVAGGIDDPDHPIGTDAMKVHAAIESVYSPDGVLVLMDLGSALLSAEIALELLSPVQQANVVLCAAPLVEGALAAAVQASIGSNIRQVLAEAQGALAAKSQQLKPPENAEITPADLTPPRDVPALALTVKNKMGLHARPAAHFVKVASRYQAEIRVTKDSKTANGKSINQVATLGVRQGEQITVTAAGADASAALAALKTLAENNFGEMDEPEMLSLPVPAAASATSFDEIVGIPASPGIAIGPVCYYQPKLPDITAQKVTDVVAEWAKLTLAVASAEAEIKELQAEASRRVGSANAAIFEAHGVFLTDPALLDAAKARIFEGRLNAAAAWQHSVEAMAAGYGSPDGEDPRGRADLLDVGRRVLHQLLNVETPSLELDRPAIIFAADLSPSDTAGLDPAKVLGICTELGGGTSHTVILARALGIPAIVGLNGALRQVPAGHLIALDGTTGQLWVNPAEAQLAELEARRTAWEQTQQQARAMARQPAVTQDGRVIEIAANIAGPYETTIALEFGAEGVGLFRTEFLFMGRAMPPTEAEQLAVYQQIAQAMGQRPLIIRTLDVGGDKPIPYLELGRESNPFLGQRGIRYCLTHPDIFKPQLRAISRASAGHNIKLMFPMIGTLAELRQARQLLGEVQAELRADGIAFDETMDVGVMIEVPSAVAIADQLATEADFFSVGSNDLTQYVMAADRGNGSVANLANALHPAILRLIQQTVTAAHTAGIWVGLCGELAGNALAAPILVGLGLDELSMSAPNIPAVKAAIRQVSLAQAQQLAQEVLAMESAEAVESYCLLSSELNYGNIVM